MRLSHSLPEDIEEDPVGLNKYLREDKMGKYQAGTLKSFDI